MNSLVNSLWSYSQFLSQLNRKEIYKHTRTSSKARFDFVSDKLACRFFILRQTNWLNVFILCQTNWLVVFIVCQTNWLAVFVPCQTNWLVVFNLYQTNWPVVYYSVSDKLTCYYCDKSIFSSILRSPQR